MLTIGKAAWVRMKIPSKSSGLMCFVAGFFILAGCLAMNDGAASVTTSVVGGDDVIKVKTGEREGAEKEVLGPLRVWHLVFLVGLVLVIALTVVCCCVECRIPRTRQEIEETYRRRLMNQKYLRQLERTPDVILRNSIGASSNDKSEDLSEPNPTRGIRQLQQQQQRQQGTHSHTHTSEHQYNQTARRQHRQHQHLHQHQHHHQHQPQQRQHAGAEQSAASSDRMDVAVTGASGRMARIAKSQMYGVQTPFALSAITALQKQKQSQRQQREQT